jgi:hypothetical protein
LILAIPACILANNMQTTQPSPISNRQSPYALASAAIAALLVFAAPAYSSSSTIPSEFTLGTPGWTDSSISPVLALRTEVQNGFLYDEGLTSTFLSPLSDVNWLMFATVATPTSADCPINSTDYLYFSVTNPQSGTASSATSQGWVNVEVSPAGTTPTT